MPFGYIKVPEKPQKPQKPDNTDTILEITAGTIKIEIPRSHTEHPKKLLFTIGIGFFLSIFIIQGFLGFFYSTILIIVCLEILEREQIRRGAYTVLIQILDQQLAHLQKLQHERTTKEGK